MYVCVCVCVCVRVTEGKCQCYLRLLDYADHVWLYWLNMGNCEAINTQDLHEQHTRFARATHKVCTSNTQDLHEQRIRFAQATHKNCTSTFSNVLFSRYWEVSLNISVECFVSGRVHEIDYKQSVFHVHIAQSVVNKVWPRSQDSHDAWKCRSHPSLHHAPKDPKQ